MNVSLDRLWWGPKFWKVLHTLAECSGGLQSPILQNDEADIWKILLKAQGFVMPCLQCKDHYLKYRLYNSIPDLRKIINQERKKFLTHWLWECHTRVNRETQKESLPEEELGQLYMNRTIRSDIEELYSMFTIGLQQKQLQREDTHRWKMCITRLQILYGL